MSVSSRIVDIVTGIGADPASRRMPQCGGKLTVGHIFICSLECLVDKQRINGVFLQAAPDRQGRAAGRACACATAARVIATRATGRARVL